LQDAIREYEFKTAPQVLVVVLKRFYIDGSKDARYVGLSTELELMHHLGNLPDTAYDAAIGVGGKGLCAMPEVSFSNL
jgi:hypothetical protein